MADEEREEGMLIADSGKHLQGLARQGHPQAVVGGQGGQPLMGLVADIGQYRFDLARRPETQRGLTLVGNQPAGANVPARP